MNRNDELKGAEFELENTLTLGGCDENGKPIYNGITELFLTARDNENILYPKMMLRFSENSPREYIEKISASLRSGKSFSLYANDTTIIPALIASGVEKKDAIDYAVGTLYLLHNTDAEAITYDLAKLVSLMANDGLYEGVRLMEEESIRLMEQRIETPTPGGSYQAIPMRCWDDLYGRDTIYFHTGSAYGVFNAATYDPATGDGVVVLTTGGSGSKDQYGIYKSSAEINAYIYDLLK